MTSDTQNLIGIFRTTEINQACNIITNPAITDDISAYAAFVASLISPWCLDYTYDGLVAYFAATGWNSAAANNQCKVETEYPKEKKTKNWCLSKL
jgi:hypothetical protein